MEQILKYKSSETLISRIKENLSTYDSAGIVDVGKFYFWIKRELQLLGNYIYQDNIEILDVYNNKCLLPENFIKLYALYTLHGVEKEKIYETTGLQQKFVYRTEQLVENLVAEDCMDRCYSTPQITTFQSFIDGSVFYPRWNKTASRLLRYSSRINTNLCDEDSPNFYSDCPYEFNMDERCLYFNFHEGKGQVLLQYLAFPYDEDGYPLIPDDAKIEQAIEDYIMFKMFEWMYLNDITNSSVQKMQYLEMKYNTSHKSALNYVKLPSYQDSVEMAYKNVKNRFKLLEIKRNGRYAYNTTDRDAERYRYNSINISRI